MKLSFYIDKVDSKVHFRIFVKGNLAGRLSLPAEEAKEFLLVHYIHKSNTLFVDNCDSELMELWDEEYFPLIKITKLPLVKTFKEDPSIPIPEVEEDRIALIEAIAKQAQKPFEESRYKNWMILIKKFVDAERFEDAVAILRLGKSEESMKKLKIDPDFKAISVKIAKYL